MYFICLRRLTYYDLSLLSHHGSLSVIDARLLYYPCKYVRSLVTKWSYLNVTKHVILFVATVISGF